MVSFVSPSFCLFIRRGIQRRNNKRPYHFSPPSLLFGATENKPTQGHGADTLPAHERRGPNNGGYDDVYDDYVIRAGEIWLDRYTIRKPLGKGSFGQVVEAFDSVLQKLVAIKIIKARATFTNQGKIELRILKYVNEKDPEDSNCIGGLCLFLVSLTFPRSHLHPS